MSKYLRSGILAVLALTITVGIAARPIRAADEKITLEKRIEKLEKKVSALQKKLQYVSVEQDPINGLDGPHVIFEGCNVHIRSGSGDTTDGTVDLVNRVIIPDVEPIGLGNLVIGYNEKPQTGFSFRGGSHNLIVGPGHSYTSVAGVLSGQENRVTGPLSSAISGYRNEATGYASGVGGGYSNTASGGYSCVNGGSQNTSGDYYSSVGGGFFNDATGYYATVAGGYNNTASGSEASVSGGNDNTASGERSSVSGGSNHSALNYADWRAGSLFEDN